MLKKKSKSQLLTAFQLVQRVKTTEELEAVQRLRYQVHVVEGKQKNHPEADHRTKRICSKVDELPETRIYYVGTPEKTKATMRLRCWQPGQIPPVLQRTYSMDLLPPLQDLVVCETTGMVARKTSRGSLSVLGMLAHSIYDTIQETGASVACATCRPGLLRGYKQLGYRSYGGELIETRAGDTLLPVLCLLEVEQLRRARSPLLPIFERLKREGHIPPADILEKLERLLSERHAMELEQQAIAEEIEGSLTQNVQSRLSEFLPGDLFQRLISHGVAIDVEANVEVVHQGDNDQDLYIVLDGSLDVHVNGDYRATLVQGDTFGEVAILRSDGRRMASVKTTSPSRLLVVQHKTLARLEKQSPTEALEVYKALVALLMRWAAKQL